MSPLVMLSCICLLVLFVIRMLTVFVNLFIWMIVHDRYFYLYCVFLLHNKGEYPFIKIFVFVKRVKEGNVFFPQRQSLLF